MVEFVLKTVDDLSDEIKITSVLEELDKLPPEYRNGVLSGSIPSIPMAKILLQEDNERKKKAAGRGGSKPYPGSQKEPLPTSGVVFPGKTILPQSAQDIIEPDNRRRRIRNEQARQAVTLAANLLEKIDLSIGQLDQNTKDEIDRLLAVLGKMRFGKNADVVSIIEEKYPDALRQIRRLQMQMVYNEREALDQETRTKK